MNARNGTATILMLGFVFFQSLLPLFIAFGGGESPFLFSAAWRMGETAALTLVLLTVFRKTTFSGKTWRTVGSRSLSVPTTLWTVGLFSLAMYAWATRYIEAAAAAALFETWPVFMVILTGWLFRLEGRYRKTTLKTWLAFALAIAGSVLVIASQAGGFGAFVSEETNWARLAAGVILITCAALLVALSSYGFRWTADFASAMTPTGEGERRRMELFGAVVGLLLVDLASTPLIALAGMARGESLSQDAAVWGVAGGLFISCGGSLLWRWANMVSSDLAVNALSYAALPLSLIWLFAFNRAGDVKVGYLLAGVALIIAACAGCVEWRRNRS